MRNNILLRRGGGHFQGHPTISLPRFRRFCKNYHCFTLVWHRVVKTVPTKFKPLFFQNYWQYKDRTNAIHIRISNHLYANVFAVLPLHFDDYFQPHSKIR
jgi:hypothetical protein